MDSDEDNMLKYRDFCNLCAEQVLHQTNTSASASNYMSASHASGSNFSKIIKELKSKHPGASKGRGGPNFVNKRGVSASRQQKASARGASDNYAKTKNIDQMVGNQPFVSTELHRFMTKMQDLPSGNQVHSPKHNRFDSIRDEEVYNHIGNSGGSAGPKGANAS